MEEMRPSNGASMKPSPGGLWGFLLRLFGKLELEEDEAPVRAKTPLHATRTPALGKTPALAATPVPGKTPVPPLTAPPAGAGIEEFARFAGIAVKVADACSTAADAVSDEVKNDLLTHIHEHKPPPNSFPVLSTRILNLLARPDVDISDLVRLISQDPALSANVLRVANSAALRGLSEIQNVRDAITRMGLRDVTEVAGAMASRSLFSPEARAEYSLHRERWVELFLDATVVAMGAARLAMETRRGRSDRAFLAGMLHDVGKTLVLKSIATLHLRSRETYTFPDPAIDGLLEALHVTVGTEIQKHWSLPSYLVTVCEKHHDTAVPNDPELDEVHLVRVVSGLRHIDVGQALAPAKIAQINDSLNALGMNGFQFRAFHTEFKEIARRMSHFVAD
jgi:HD-like signal output (HDOD) protein